MRFVEVNIFGFGKWIDHTFVFPKENGIISIYGENESGKSTFQQFILYMLFDLPPKMREFYQPKTSSKFGGQLTITDHEEGTFTIERTAEQFICTFPDGRTEGSEWYASYMEGVSKHLYEAIYAFSAEQLEAIRKMKDQELSDVLFSVGITGASTVYETEIFLQKEMDHIFKPQGTKPILNKQIVKVNELQETVHEQQIKEQSYARLIEEKRLIELEMESLEQLVQHTQEQLLFFKQIDHLLPSIFSFKEHEAKLESYDSNEMFPEQGIQRYEELKRELLPIKTKSDSLQNMMENLQKRLEQKEDETAPLAVYHEAEQIIKQRQTYEDLANQLYMNKLEIKQIDQQLREHAQLIDAPIDLIEGKKFPLQVQKEWEDIARKEVDIMQVKEQLKEEQKYILNQEKMLSEQIKLAETNVYSEEKIREMQEKVKAHDEHKRLKREFEHRQSVWDDFQAQRKGLAGKAMLGSLIIGFLFIALYFVLDSSALLILGIVAMIAGIVIYFTMQATVGHIHSMLSEDSMAVTPISDATRIEYNRKLNEQLEWTQRVTGLTIDKENVEKKISMLEGRIGQQDVAHQILQDRIRKNREEFPLLAGINPAHWSGLFDTVQKMKALDDQKTNKLEKQRMIRSQFEEIDQELQQYQRFIPQEETNRVTMAALEKWMYSFEKHKEQMDEDSRAQHEYRRQQEELQEQINVIQKEINELFTFAQVENEEDFYRANERFRAKTESEQIVSQFKSHVTHAFTEGMQREILENPWSKQSVQVSMEKLEQKQSEAVNKMAALQKQLAEIKHTIQEQELSNELSKVNFAYEIEKEELQSLAKEWLILKIAHESLRNAKMNYQEKYLNQIIEITGRYFNKMTNNRYKQIIPPTENELFKVISTAGQSFNITALSKGTVDQLYIALRLAIGYVMSEKYDVPFLIDDGFVHFDHERMTQAIEVMNEIAETKQIILFTCNREVGKLTDAIELAKQSSFVS